MAIGYTTYWLLLMGGILLLGVLFLPGGILGFLEELMARGSGRTGHEGGGGPRCFFERKR